MQCNALNTVNLPNSLKSLGQQAFADCPKLSTVNFNNGLESIGKACFYLDKSLKSATLPNSVSELGEGVFHKCESLETLSLGNSLKTVEYMLADSCSSLKAIYIPESVTSIKDLAFNRCYSLTKVIIDKNVKTMGEGVFQFCNDLEDIYTFIEKPFIINENVFNSSTNVYGFATLHVPYGTSSRYKSISSWSNFNKIKEMAEGTTAGIDSQFLNDSSQSATNVLRRVKGIYTLTGVKVSDDAADVKALKSGVYIVNGRKVAVK